MARNDWAALLTEPAAEYLARTELQRFGMDPYLPQFKKRHATRTGAYVMRDYPLFPRYLLIHINYAYNPAIRLARGIAKHRPVLADENGKPWRAPARVVEAVQDAERRGLFDEILHRGDNVKLAYGVLSTVKSVLSSDDSNPMVELLMPLFGGARATVDPAKIVHTS